MGHSVCQTSFHNLILAVLESSKMQNCVFRDISLTKLNILLNKGTIECNCNLALILLSNISVSVEYKRRKLEVQFTAIASLSPHVNLMTT